MSILDCWEKKAQSFTRRTKEKAVSMSEITRIRTLISGEEKNFRSLCTQLGEQYVKLHSEDYDPAFQELMSLCKASQARTEGYRQEIMQLKKVRPCPACGMEVPIDFAYCNFCGAKLPEIEPVIPEGFHKCPGCQAVIPDTMKFCNHCGTAQEPAPEEPVPEQASPQCGVPDGQEAPAEPAAEVCPQAEDSPREPDCPGPDASQTN